MKKDIFIQGERISDTSSDLHTIDASGCYLIPGLIDIHFHGCMGYDFCDATPESLHAIAKYELQCGITTICPATTTLSKESLIKICKNAKSYHDAWKPGNTSRLCGINLEGPFIAAGKKGAQNLKYITDPDLKMFQQLMDVSGNLIKLITIAPETNHAMEFIREFSSKARISLGHTNCDYETANNAFLAGASHITHLFNAMPAFHHRNPSFISAGLDHKNVTPEIICDGIHVHPAAVRAALAMFGDDRMIFISDSIMATGMPNGNYSLGRLAVKKANGICSLADGTIAGSAFHLMDCMRNAVQKINIPLETAVKCATINPAKAISEDKEYGSIEPGKYADLLLLDQETLNLEKVIIHGIVSD